MYIIKTYQSPNFNTRPKPVTHVVLHYTDLESAKVSLDLLCKPESKVSAHYLIDINGDIYELVAPNQRAWHAGVSHIDGQDNVNDFSIGIELQNKGHSVFPLEAYPLVQMEALVRLLNTLHDVYHFPKENVVGHSDVAPGRKIDPGEHFDWLWLKSHGYGR
ncbi:MAG: hypothetical protein CNLJKLNK_00272 [Holosporales bacterium]